MIVSHFEYAKFFRSHPALIPHTVDLVIFACLDFQEFVIWGLEFTNYINFDDR